MVSYLNTTFSSFFIRYCLANRKKQLYGTLYGFCFTQRKFGTAKVAQSNRNLAHTKNIVQFYIKIYVKLPAKERQEPAEQTKC